MNPIKNQETEDFCQRVAKIYKGNAKAAHQMFTEYLTKNKLVYWEQLAVKERIVNLIKENK